MRSIARNLFLTLLLATAGQSNALAVSAAAEIFQAPASTAPVTLRAAGKTPALSVKLTAPPVLHHSKSAAVDANIAPQTVGIGRELPADAAKELDPATWGWQSTNDGGQIGSQSFCSEQAHGLRAGMLVYALPDAAELRFFVPTIDTPLPSAVAMVTGAEINASLARDRAARDADAGQTVLYWSPVVDGECIGVELYLPAAFPIESVRLAVPRLSHIYDMPQRPAPQAKLGVTDSGTCTEDISCHLDTWGDVATAVARMFMTGDDGSTFACSGTLIADKDPSNQIPYFITARHCISTQSVASSLQTFWFFRTASCHALIDAAGLKTLNGGATLLATLPDLDITLLRLNSIPPSGATMVGWDAEYVAPIVRIGSVSHPKGDLLKLALGNMHGYVNCYWPAADNIAGCGQDVGSQGNFMVPSFDLGMPQQGSSGSGLFLDGSHKLIGICSSVLWTDENGNGAVDCSETVKRYMYGRFDLAYQKSLKQWLGVDHACQSEPGSWGYCSDPACGPCPEGMGDCDSDQECQSGLVCSSNVGARYGWEATLDVCEKTSLNKTVSQCTKQPGSWDYCSNPQCGPCAAGQGDCDSDAECRSGLSCLDNTGASYGFQATVATCGVKNNGECPLKNGDWGYCSDPRCGPCAVGKGDCDTDAECLTGLICQSNVGAHYGLPETMDVCELPGQTTCNKQPGDWDYCSDPACGPCNEGQGDCDSDAECNSDLQCGFNAGEAYGLPETMDVCIKRQP